MADNSELDKKWFIDECFFDGIKEPTQIMQDAFQEKVAFLLSNCIDGFSLGEVANARNEAFKQYRSNGLNAVWQN